MRVALVSDHVPVWPLARALAGRGHRVALYLTGEQAGRPGMPGPASGPDPPVPGLEVVWLCRLPGRAERTAGAGNLDGATGRADWPGGLAAAGSDPLAQVRAMARRLSAAWKADPPCVLHAFSWTAGLAALVAAEQVTRAARRPGVVLTFDGVHAWTGAPAMAAMVRVPGPREVQLRTVAARGASLVLARSGAEEEHLLHMGVQRRCLTVVPPGIALEVFNCDGPVAPRGPRPRILLLDRSPAGPAGAGAADAMVAMRRVRHAELLIVSVGAARPPGQGRRPHVGAVRSVAAGLGVAEQVRWAGYVPPEGLPPLLRSADAVVCPAPADPEATTAMAAMACGAPVVADAVGPVTDVVIDQTTGVLVQPGDPARFGPVLAALLADPTRLAGYRAAAADRARARYSWDRIAADTEAAYCRLTGGHARAARPRAGRVPVAPPRAGLRPVAAPAVAPARAG